MGLGRKKDVQQPAAGAPSDSVGLTVLPGQELPEWAVSTLATPAWADQHTAAFAGQPGFSQPVQTTLTELVSQPPAATAFVAPPIVPQGAVPGVPADGPDSLRFLRGNALESIPEPTPGAPQGLAALTIPGQGVRAADSSGHPLAPVALAMAAASSTNSAAASRPGSGPLGGPTAPLATDNSPFGPFVPLGQPVAAGSPGAAQAHGPMPMGTMPMGTVPQGTVPQGATPMGAMPMTAAPMNFPAGAQPGYDVAANGHVWSQYSAPQGFMPAPAGQPHPGDAYAAAQYAAPGYGAPGYGAPGYGAPGYGPNAEADPASAGSTGRNSRARNTGERRVGAKGVGLAIGGIAVAGALAVAGMTFLGGSEDAADAAGASAGVPASVTVPASIGSLTGTADDAAQAQASVALGLPMRATGPSAAQAYAASADGPLQAAVGVSAVGNSTNAAAQFAARTGAKLSAPASVGGITCQTATKTPKTPAGSFCNWTTPTAGRAFVVGADASKALVTAKTIRAAIPVVK